MALDLLHFQYRLSFFFCDVRHWARWIDKKYPSIEAVRIQEGMKTEERVKGDVCVFIDEREVAEERG